MPGLDGTGPAGLGPMTGRGMGFCAVRLDETRMPGARDAHTARMNDKEVITMPWGDGTGPAGMGPMTGRAAGYCAGYGVPGYVSPVVGAGYGARPLPGPYAPAAYPQSMGRYGYPMMGWGRGFGRGRGLGRGRGFGRGRGRGRWW